MPPPPNEAVTGEKRKTLAERAGEPFRKPPAPGINKQLNSGMKVSTSAGVYRQPSFSSSVASSRPSSVASSRNVSNGSYTSTMSTGSRPPSRQAHRPQSAMTGSMIQKPQSVQSRPFSSMDAHALGPATGRGQGKSSGRTPFPSNLVDCPDILECTEGNMSYDTQSQPASDRASSNPSENRHRAISISTAMDGLSLDESRADCNPWATQKREASLTTALGNMSLNSKEPGKFPFSSNPTTPSQIPKRKPNAAVHAPLRSPIKSSKKTPVPSPRFLNRHTNMPFTEAFDPDDRLSNMESMMSEFKNTLNGATTENNGLREMVAVYKARGLLRVPIHLGSY